MPFINSKVNVALSEEEKTALKSKLGQAISLIPGKSESWLMVDFEDNCSLYFKGNNSTKLAFVEVKLFGHASERDYDRLTAEICKIYKDVLSIAQDKIYVKYEEVDHWGWNGGNF
ncbi:phenylpyruvate tautomerase MIF-related protein [Lacrimispora sp.]|uniref:phenylpyruvate tautomerase MIF-related protein n=1 Tax=Lacrimispora sp. TaxID=2719234 RepID=UPI00289B0F42|nr:phenylpyruvate tautomerase MIF-related protein [Lacrimispora sp.]